MKKLGGVLLVVLLGAGAAACGGAPESITAPGDARRGGHMYGGGNRSNDGLVTADSTLTTTSVSGDAECLDERGGGMLGSGNLVDVPACRTP